ncbi:toll-like receptor 6 [Liolophura sinensis]|uniref:toll-like receptor 6 n=1 Tax=Liolophura sinensis TaxID=3198878 RepID=UPI0031587298
MACRMSIAMVAFCMIELLNTVTAFPASSTGFRPSPFPPAWKRACQQSVPSVPVGDEYSHVSTSRLLVRVFCSLTDRDDLQWTDFRSWAAKAHSVQIALHVNCPVRHQGILRLPWPMKARNLVYLKVENCALMDYERELLSAHLLGLSDSLRVLHISDCLMYRDLTAMGFVMDNGKNLSKDVFCGPLSLRSLVLRSLTHKFINFQENTKSRLTKLDMSRRVLKSAKTFIPVSNLQENPIMCHYHSLLHMDESGNRYLGRQHFLFMQFKASYPALLAYNLSDIGVTSVPHELTSWRFKFPKLQHLDLSRNSVTGFDFVDYHGMSTGPPGIIDLSHNNISKISKKGFRILTHLHTATVILTGNPLSCKCGDNSYLFSLSATDMAKYDYLRKLPCYYPKKSRGTPFNEIPRDQILCRPTTRPSLKLTVSVTLGTILLLIVVLVFCIAQYLKSRGPKPTVSEDFSHSQPDVVHVNHIEHNKSFIDNNEMEKF